MCKDLDRMTNHRGDTAIDILYLANLSLNQARKPHEDTCDMLVALLLGEASAEELFYESVSVLP